MPLKGEARTEYMRDYMRRRRAAERAGATKPAAPDHDALEARNAALEQELAQAKARIAELEKAGTVAAAEIAALKGELQDALGFRFARFAPSHASPRLRNPRCRRTRSATASSRASGPGSGTLCPSWMPRENSTTRLP